MRDGRRALFSLALDFYRQPLRHRGWVNATRPLPAGVGDLLESEAADSAPLERRAASLRVTPEELRAAVRFFIRQVWLVEGADPYRTLGLAPGASLEQVRDHYRKLIRLHHPDRAGALGEWDTAYAARINRAYRLLRDPGKRPDPDGRTQPAGGPVPKRRNSPGRSPMRAPSRQWPRRAILRWLFKTSRGQPGACQQRCPASRLFQRLGLVLSLAAVTASVLFVAHHLLVLYASLAAEGLRPTAPLDAAERAQIMTEPLDQAKGHMQEARLIESKGDNAFDTYNAVLLLDRKNREAREGLTRISQRLTEDAESARQAGDLERSLALIDQGLRVDPEGSGFHTLKDAVAEEQRALGEKHRRLVAQWLERAQGQFQSGRLTTPPGDNAFETYRMLLAVVPGQAEALAGLEQIAERYVQLAEAAREPGNVEASLALIDQGLQAVPGHARLAELRTALSSEAIGSTALGGPSLYRYLGYTRPYRDASE